MKNLKLSRESEFDLHENEPVGEHIFICFTQRFFLTLREKSTRKWAIVLINHV